MRGQAGEIMMPPVAGKGDALKVLPFFNMDRIKRAFDFSTAKGLLLLMKNVSNNSHLVVLPGKLKLNELTSENPSGSAWLCKRRLSCSGPADPDQHLISYLSKEETVLKLELPVLKSEPHPASFCWEGTRGFSHLHLRSTCRNKGVGNKYCMFFSTPQ